MPLATIRQIYDTNIFGALSVLQAFVPLLEKSTAPRVVNVASESGSLANISNPEWFAYSKEFNDAKWKINSACPR